MPFRQWWEARRASLLRSYRFIVLGKRPRSTRTARSAPPAVVAAVKKKKDEVLPTASHPSLTQERVHSKGIQRTADNDEDGSADAIASAPLWDVSVTWQPASCATVVRVALLCLCVLALSCAQGAWRDALKSIFMSERDFAEVGMGGLLHIESVADASYDACASFGTENDIYFERFGGLWCTRANYRPPASIDTSDGTPGLIEMEDLRKVFATKSDANEYYQRFWGRLVRPVVRFSDLQEANRGFSCVGRDCRVYTWVEAVDRLERWWGDDVPPAFDVSDGAPRFMKRHVVYIFRTGRAVVRLRIAGDAERFQPQDAGSIVRRVYAVVTRSLRPQREEWRRRSFLRDDSDEHTSTAMSVTYSALSAVDFVLVSMFGWTGSAMVTATESRTKIPFSPIDSFKQPGERLSSSLSAASASLDFIVSSGAISTSSVASAAASEGANNQPRMAPVTKSRAIMDRVDGLIDTLRRQVDDRAEPYRSVLSDLKDLRRVLKSAQHHEVLLRTKHEELRRLLGLDGAIDASSLLSSAAESLSLSSVNSFSLQPTATPVLVSTWNIGRSGDGMDAVSGGSCNDRNDRDCHCEDVMPFSFGFNATEASSRDMRPPGGNLRVGIAVCALGMIILAYIARAAFKSGAHPSTASADVAAVEDTVVMEHGSSSALPPTIVADPLTRNGILRSEKRTRKHSTKKTGARAKAVNSVPINESTRCGPTDNAVPGIAVRDNAIPETPSSAAEPVMVSSSDDAAYTDDGVNAQTSEGGSCQNVTLVQIDQTDQTEQIGHTSDPIAVPPEYVGLTLRVDSRSVDGLPSNDAASAQTDEPLSNGPVIVIDNSRIPANSRSARLSFDSTSKCSDDGCSRGSSVCDADDSLGTFESADSESARTTSPECRRGGSVQSVGCRCGNNACQNGPSPSSQASPCVSPVAHPVCDSASDLHGPHTAVQPADAPEASDDSGFADDVSPKTSVSSCSSDSSDTRDVSRDGSPRVGRPRKRRGHSESCSLATASGKSSYLAPSHASCSALPDSESVRNRTQSDSVESPHSKSRRGKAAASVSHDRHVSCGSSDDGLIGHPPNRKARRASARMLAVYCYNCGVQGHCGQECTEMTMDEMLQFQQYQMVVPDMHLFDPSNSNLRF